MLEVVLSEAVVITAIVTQEDITVLAMPHCLVSLLLIVVAVVAATTIFCSSSWEVRLAEATSSRCVSRTAWSFSAGVATNQLLCQGNSKLHRFVW